MAIVLIDFGPFPYIYISIALCVCKHVCMRGVCKCLWSGAGGGGGVRKVPTIIGLSASQWFASLSFICRLFMGLGGALVWGTGIPLLTSIAPEYAGRVTSLAESAIGFGLAIGPPLGSAMYSLGGYELPFLTSGAIELVLALLVFYALPNGPADEDNEKKS